ncbi:response regulator transcription factor [Candidatus Saccharibacteria bacterium]|nr:response regulator transcription factor [Candidatus Saccharibacteria bacterium]
MKVLLVEDEVKLAKAIKTGLEQDGYAVDLNTNYDDGLAYATTEDYDFIILDRMLPGGKDGSDICSLIRRKGITTPVIMLTAMGETEDIIQGLDEGADDYLTKPFKFDELLARLRALKRRPKNVVEKVIKFGNLQINTTNKEVSRFSSNKLTTKQTPIKLSKKEFAVLEYLAVNKGTIASKEQILSHVWDFDSDVLPNTVEVFIKSIRKKIDEPGSDSLIETVRGFGYRMRVVNV